MSDKTNVITAQETRASNSLADKIAALIKELTDEISTTQSEWVKIRDAAEIAVLTAALGELVNVIGNLLEKEN